MRKEGKECREEGKKKREKSKMEGRRKQGKDVGHKKKA